MAKITENDLKNRDLLNAKIAEGVGLSDQEAAMIDKLNDKYDTYLKNIDEAVAKAKEEKSILQSMAPLVADMNELICRKPPSQNTKLKFKEKSLLESFKEKPSLTD